MNDDLGFGSNRSPAPPLLGGTPPGLARSSSRIVPLSLAVGLLIAGLLNMQPASAADACGDLLAAIPTLSGGSPLISMANGRSYEEMYDACDSHDTFAGRPLPKHGGQSLRCSTDPNRVGKLLKYPDGTITFIAKASVDADGSKLACGTGWPNRCGTWLGFDTGSIRKDVNAEDTPFVVVPGAVPGTEINFRKDTGVQAGDLAVAVANGRCSFGVVGDSGPYFRLGELSLRSHEDLGNPQCRTKGQYPCKGLVHGSGQTIASGVQYVIFPRTRPAQLYSQNVNEKAAADGQKATLAFLAKYAR